MFIVIYKRCHLDPHKNVLRDWSPLLRITWRWNFLYRCRNIFGYPLFYRQLRWNNWQVKNKVGAIFVTEEKKMFFFGRSPKNIGHTGYIHLFLEIRHFSKLNNMFYVFYEYSSVLCFDIYWRLWHLYFKRLRDIVKRRTISENAYLTKPRKCLPKSTDSLLNIKVK